MGTTATGELRTLAQQVADALPAEIVEEVVLTGSVSRGVADDVSDIEMLVVTSETLSLEDCYGHAGAAGLERLGSWGAPEAPAHHVSGYRDSVPVELIWWPRECAQGRVDGLLRGEAPSTSDALVHGVALRGGKLLATWQERLRTYPPELAAARIEEGALRWGGFAAAGVLTLARPGDRLQLAEWLVDAATRVLTIVFALNRVWQPTSKRLRGRVEPLATKPHRLVERIEEALLEPDASRALVVMTELQLDTVLLAPSGPNVDRARVWLTEALEVLHRSPQRPGR